MKKKYAAAVLALLAAALYAVNIPLSKLLLAHATPMMMAAFLYLGAGLGLFVYSLICKAVGRTAIKEPLTKKELPFVIAMVVLDVAAPILLMFGISHTASANVSLLNNFEIVATSLIALFIFKEAISRKLWIAIVMVTLAGILLGLESTESFQFSIGSAFVIGACICWGFENNCTKKLSIKSSVQIVIIKGCCSGIVSLIIAIICGERFPEFVWICSVLALGFVSYGLSINFYVMAQRSLGAAKTSAFYSVAPFFGVAFSMVLLGEQPGLRFFFALSIIAVSTAIMIKDTLDSQHTHEPPHKGNTDIGGV